MTATAQQDTPTQTPPAALPPHSVPGAPLRAALAHLGRVIPVRSSNPLLTGLLMRAQDGVLTLSGTNLESDWEIKVAVPGLENFAGTVNGNRLARVVALTGKQSAVLFGVKAWWLSLYAEKAGVLMRLPVQPLAECGAHPMQEESLPKMPEGAASVPAGELVTALQSVLYACAKEAFQTSFRGVCFAEREGRGEVVASDGYRIALHRLSAVLPYMILPRRTVELLISRLGSVPAETPVQFAALSYAQAPATAPEAHMPANSIRMRIGDDTDAVLKGLDSQFADYARVLLSGESVSGEWRRSPLLARLRALDLLVERNANNRVDLTQAGTLLHLSVESDEGEAVSTLDLSTPLGGAPSIQAHYNLAHLRQAAQNAPDEDLRVGIQYVDPKNTANRMLEIQCGNYRAVIVSLRA